jgi:hypothetical protein
MAKEKRAAASAATCAAPRSKAAATGNPLKERSLIVRGSELAARELVASGKPFTGAAYSRLVLQKMGYTEWAVNDQGTRTRLHAKEVKLAAFKRAGADEKWLSSREMGKLGGPKRDPPLPVLLPPLPTAEESELVSSPSVPTAEELQHQLEHHADAARLLSEGVLRIPSLLSAQQAREVLLALGAPGALEDKEQVLRASSGNGEGGGYTTIRRTPPALAAACAALRAWLQPPLPDGKQDKCLLLRYGDGGVNWAHQDQADGAWQAVMLLNPPHEYAGGHLYVVDAAGAPPRTRTEVPFENAGDVVVFAANSSAPGGRHWYHGMTEVTRGQRFAVGLFQ